VGREIRKTVAKELHAIKEKKIVRQVSKPKLIAAPVLQTLPQHKTIHIIPSTLQKISAFPLSKLNYQFTTILEEKFSPWMSQEVYQAQYDDGTYQDSYPAYIQTNEFGERRVIKLSSQSDTKWSTTSARSMKYIQEVNVRNTMKGKRMLSLHVNYIGSQAFYSAVWVKQSVYDRESRRLEEYGVSFNELSNETPHTESIQTSFLDSNHKNNREASFSNWLDASEFSSLVYTYFVNKKTYPIYTEINQQGKRRYIEVSYQPPLYWTIHRAITRKQLNKINAQLTVKGRKLLTLHSVDIYGEKFYTGMWVYAKFYDRERKKLEKFGIYPPSLN